MVKPTRHQARGGQKAQAEPAAAWATNNHSPNQETCRRGLHTMATNQQHSTTDAESRRTIFEPYGIDDSTVLARDTRRSLKQTGFKEYQPSPHFSEAMGKAFRGAFIERANIPIIPEALDVAIPEARNDTTHKFLDSVTSQLGIVVPYFYKRVVAEFGHAVKAGYDFQAGIYWEGDDDGRGPMISK